MQVVFIDKTTLNIGPGSELVIDRFVFNPATANGEMALSLAKGALRIVGGQATHTGGATVTTPVATIGVRGGIAVITHCPPTARRCVPEGTQATNVFGRISVEAGGVTERITRPDFTTNVASRLENLTKDIGTPRGILISEETKDAMGESFVVLPAGETELRGRQKTIKLFALDKEVT